MEIKFYTNNVAPGQMARFSLSVPVECDGVRWEHIFEGSIIHSQIRGGLAVVWPRCGRYFASTPATRDQTEAVEALILQRFMAWSSKV